jgi:hypothetical protein
MNIKELKNIIEMAKNYGTGTIEYFFTIYIPVSDAIAENNRAVIEYLVNCETNERKNLLKAIEDGAKSLNLFKSHKLRSTLKRDMKTARKIDTNTAIYELYNYSLP